MLFLLFYLFGEGLLGIETPLSLTLADLGALALTGYFGRTHLLSLEGLQLRGIK